MSQESKAIADCDSTADVATFLICASNDPREEVCVGRRLALLGFDYRTMQFDHESPVYVFETQLVDSLGDPDISITGNPLSPEWVLDQASELCITIDGAELTPESAATVVEDIEHRVIGYLSYLEEDWVASGSPLLESRGQWGLA